MRDRAFGVEIECGAPEAAYECTCECTCEEDQEFACSYCDWGCDCDSREGSGCEYAYNLLRDNGFHDWLDDIHEDGSGVEIPSPILRGREGLIELRRVMELLSSHGFWTDHEDGLHVHHDAPEFVEDDELVVRLVELWEENLPVVDRFVSSDRRGGDHWACNSYQYAERYYQRADGPWSKFKQSKRLDDLNVDKFRSLNVTALREHGTVEFRLHEGTLDFKQALAWIHFGQAFLDMAKRRKTIITCAAPLDLLKAARVSPSATRSLLTKAAA